MRGPCWLSLLAALAGCDALFRLDHIDTSPDAMGSGTPSGGQSVAGGQNQTCAISGDGTLWCWGSNVSGEAGTGALVSTIDVPTQIATGSWSQVVTGAAHSCAI